MGVRITAGPRSSETCDDPSARSHGVQETPLLRIGKRSASAWPMRRPCVRDIHFRGGSPLRTRGLAKCRSHVRWRRSITRPGVALWVRRPAFIAYASGRRKLKPYPMHHKIVMFWGNGAHLAIPQRRQNARTVQMVKAAGVHPFAGRVALVDFRG